MLSREKTKADELQLKDEELVIRQGYEFLDEKRILLAAEILRQLDDYESLRKAYDQAIESARVALCNSIVRHGLDVLELYPKAPLHPTTPKIKEHTFLGIALPQAELIPQRTAPEYEPVDPSNEAEICRDSFRHLVFLAVKLACLSGNLYRISAEYGKTEQRARALENVLLPEIRQELKQIGDQLEMIEQEEVLRVRLADRMSGR